MKKQYLTYGFLILAVLILSGLFYFYFHFEKKTNSLVCFGSKCFKVEVASTPSEREKGLMNRTTLSQDQGMLFIFDTEDRQSFWMKNTLIPLDIVWMDSHGRILFISRDTQPCTTEECESITPLQKAKYVLEVNAGQSGMYGANEGVYANISIR